MELTKWYQKTVYVIGWIFVVLFLFGFAVGFTESIVESNQNAQIETSYSGSLNLGQALQSGGLTIDQ